MNNQLDSDYYKNLKVNVNELKQILMRISENYVCNEDEFVKELFYEGLHKSKGFCSYLENMIKKFENDNKV